MKEYLAELIQNSPSNLHARLVVREFLQARILAGLQSAGAMIPLAFMGGTALRFLYRIPRFSEDLDFSLEQAHEQYDFRNLVKAGVTRLRAENYPVDLKINDQKTVHSALVRFRGLLYELNLSPYQEEVIAIKIEVDTRPPAGAALETTIVRRYTMLHLQHHDKASLFAGKLIAILLRPYAKGRDLYDLLWYLSDPEWPEPNLTLLNNGLAQSGREIELLNAANWREAIKEQLLVIDWGKAIAEVEPFLINSAEVELLTRENIIRLLE